LAILGLDILIKVWTEYAAALIWK